MVEEPSIYCVETKQTLMDPLLEYFKKDVILEDLEAAKRLKWEASKYTSVDTKEEEYKMRKVYERMCGSHIRGRALANKIAKAGYYWPTLKGDYFEYVKKCDRCQQFVDIHKSLLELIHSVMSPWPFHKWGIDILGPFQVVAGQIKYLIMIVHYCTKWIKVESITTISAERVKVSIGRG
ncbi:hypothetical protein CR513_09583, partial [Mucuna pruriens]